MKRTKSQYTEHEMSSVQMADQASGFVRRMVENETRGWGDMDNALTRLEAKYGLPFWTLQNLRTGRAKTVEAGLFARIRAAYFAQCERQISRLQEELKIEKAICGDDSFGDLEREAADLVARIQAKKQARQMK